MAQSLRGFVGQGLGSPKGFTATPVAAGMPVSTTSGSGSVTATRHCSVIVYLWGGSGSGEANTGSSGGGGGGSGSAVRKHINLSRGQTLAWSVGAPGAGVSADASGNDGADSTVTLPNGTVMRAAGGKGGAGLAGGLGGVASGGDLNRNGQPGQSLAAGMQGGAAVGFAEDATDLIGGAGSNGSATASVTAGAGRVIIIPLRAS